MVLPLVVVVVFVSAVVVFVAVLVPALSAVGTMVVRDCALSVPSSFRYSQGHEMSAAVVAVLLGDLVLFHDGPVPIRFRVLVG